MVKFSINPVNQAILEQALERQHQLAKPYGSLGKLESYSARIAAIAQSMYPSTSSAVVVFSSDNGVWEEGVTPIGKDVTALQTANMTYGKSGIGVLCAHSKSKLIVVDVGMELKCESRYVINRKIRKSTWNIAKGPAMTREECGRAMEVGAEMAQRLKAEGIAFAGAGEMGVGNTTTSAAVICALLDADPARMTGRGAGVTEQAYQNKIDVIRRAITLNRPNREDPVDVLTKVGGFDLAALAGFYLKCAELGMCVVLDGFISMAAALAASKIEPVFKEYIFLSHRSAEPGYDAVAKELGQTPMLDLGMRLGEGTGCPLAFNVMEAAVRVLRDMATFAEISIDDTVIDDSWDKEEV